MMKQKYRKLKHIWDKYTQGWTGNIIYIALGFVIAYALNIALGIALQTDMPVVAVVSNSMYHGLQNGIICSIHPVEYEYSFDSFWKACGEWYASRGIAKEQFLSFQDANGFSKGDMIVVTGGNIKIGDIIIYDVSYQKYPIIHRVIGMNQDGTFETKGDSNPSQIQFEHSVKKEQIHGKALLSVPLLGWVKIGFMQILGLM